MTLRVERLSLANWRNLDELTIEFDPSLTMLVGPNATGKTNTVEALALLTRGTSFRHARAIDQVREGQECGWAQMRLTGDGRVLDFGFSVGSDGRRFTRNGKHIAPSRVARTLHSVIFTPDDLVFVKGAARFRRDELDTFGSAISEVYGDVARTYRHSVEQRNRLLKDASVDEGVLDVWDESVAKGGATLLSHRLSLLSRLGPLWKDAYASIADGEELTVEYESSLGPIEGNESRDRLFELLMTLFSQRRFEELRRGITLVGPHRDDFALLVGGRDGRRFASQGQQRSIVLALKLAQVAFVEEILDERPLLLLDDVMSELDTRRRASIEKLVDKGIQTIMTTTHLGYFAPTTLDRAKVVRYERR